MISVLNKVALAWYELLKDNLSVKVYRTNAPKSEKGNYVLIRKESEKQQPIKSTGWTKPVIIIEIVTKTENTAEDETTGIIDNEITQLLCPNVISELPQQSNIQITNIYKENVTFLDEYDGVKYIYRHISRYRHDVFQN